MFALSQISSSFCFKLRSICVGLAGGRGDFCGGGGDGNSIGESQKYSSTKRFLLGEWDYSLLGGPLSSSSSPSNIKIVDIYVCVGVCACRQTHARTRSSVYSITTCIVMDNIRVCCYNNYRFVCLKFKIA